MTTNVSAPVKPKPVTTITPQRPRKPAPVTRPPAAPPAPDYAAWLPSDFLSRGWCKDKFWEWEWEISTKGWPSSETADRYCIVGAIIASEEHGALRGVGKRRIVGAINTVLRQRGLTAYHSRGMGTVELFNDTKATAETALEVLREAEHRAGLR